MGSEGRWLVTGGAGYIGAHAVRSIVNAGGAATVIDDLSSGKASRLARGVDLIPESLFNGSAILRQLKGASFDVTLHFASLKNARDSTRCPEAYRESIVQGTKEAIELSRALGVSAFVFASSCAIYGDQEAVTETSPPAPLSPYGEAKLEAESALREASRSLGINVIVLRFFNVIGNGSFTDAPDSTVGHLVPDMVQHLRNGSHLTIASAHEWTPDGSCVRDFIDVRDIADAHLRAGRRLVRAQEASSFDDFNLSTGVPVSTLSLVKGLASAWGSKASVSLGAPSRGDPSRIYGAPATKSLELLGWRPRFSLQQSLRSIATAETPLN